MGVYCPYGGNYSCASSPMTASEFESTYSEWADYASGQLGWPKSLILAQWSIESSWGKEHICDSGCAYNNPANVTTCEGANCSTCTASNVIWPAWPGLCAGVPQGYVQWAQNNKVLHNNPYNYSYAQWVANAYTNGFEIPAELTQHVCLPGAKRSFGPGLQAAAAALGSSGWAGSDYAYCSSGRGTACCGDSTAYAGMTVYDRAVNYFGSTGVTSASLPSVCYPSSCPTV